MVLGVKIFLLYLMGKKMKKNQGIFLFEHKWVLSYLTDITVFYTVWKLFYYPHSQ